MKKLLSIVALALILCLGISAVLADSLSNDEIYRANFVGRQLTALDFDANGYPILTIAEIQDPSNWIISEGDYQPLPSSDEANEPVPVNNLLALFVSSANAETGDTYGVTQVIIGNIEHAKPTLITVANDDGIAAHILVMIKDNRHKMKTEYTVTDGYCYYREYCTVLGCDYKTEWKKATETPNTHKPGCSRIEVVDGKTVVICTECGNIITTYDGHAHVAEIFCDEEPTCLNNFTGTYHYVCSVDGCGVPLKTQLDANGLWEVADQVGPFIQWKVSNENAADYGFEEAADYYVVVACNADSELGDEWLAGRYDGHKWTNWSTLSKANCTENAWLIRTCWWCQAEQVMEDWGTCYGIEYAPVEIACNSKEAFTLTCIHCNGLKGGLHEVEFPNGIYGMDWEADGLGDYYAQQGHWWNGFTWIPAITLVHNYDLGSQPLYEEAATCTEVGFKIWKCKNAGCVNDGHQYYTIYEQQLGHDWPDTWVTVIEPDYDNNIQGVWMRTCKRKGCIAEQRYVGLDVAYATDPEKCAHNLVVYDEDAATCEEGGLKYLECTKCKQYWTTEPTPALGHDFEGAEWTVTVPATCEGTGVHVAKCNRCQKYVDEIILPNGHTPVEVPAQEPTCIVPGWEAYTKCDVCGIALEEIVPVVDADAHKLGDPIVTKASTCIEQGTAIGVCEYCQKAVTMKLPLAEHTWGEWTIVEPDPATETDGVKTRVCLVCGEEDEPVVIPFIATEKADYTISGFVYDMNAQEVTGNVAHVAGTKTLENVFARISFYYKDKTWAAFVVPVHADGSFFMGANTDAAYVKVNIVDNAKATQIPEEEDVYGNGNAKIIPLD